VAIKNVALYGLTKTRGAAVVIRFPARRKDERATERDVRSRLRRRSLQSHNIILRIGCASHPLGLAVN
jgi:hypothetical protein